MAFNDKCLACGKSVRVAGQDMDLNRYRDGVHVVACPHCKAENEIIVHKAAGDPGIVELVRVLPKR
jgi:hypothetical protein